jgi:hypothetical protein
MALRRGFLRTHRFAQARSVFAVAAQRCSEVFDPPGCVTLFRLPEETEEELDVRWEHWLDDADRWADFFSKLEAIQAGDLAVVLRGLDLVSEADVAACARLTRSAEGRAIPLPGTYRADEATLALLALGFARGEPGALAVPYARYEG